MKRFGKLFPAAMALMLLSALAAPALALDTGGVLRSSAGNYGTVIGDGYVSAEIGDQDIIWLYEESYDSEPVWYGLDNSDGVFPPGSRIWVKYEKPDEWSGSGNSVPTDAGSYKIGLDISDDAPWVAPEGATLFVQVGSGQTPETVEGSITTPDGEAIGDVELYKLGCPEGVGTFAAVPFPNDIQALGAEGSSGGNGVILVEGSITNCSNAGGVCGENDDGHPDNSYYGGITGSVFSGSASWLMALALVELGVIVGLVVGLFAKKKKN